MAAPYATAASAVRPRRRSRSARIAWNKWYPFERKAIDQAKRRLRSFDFGDGHRAIESHDRARRNRLQLVVQLQDLAPVRG